MKNVKNGVLGLLFMLPIFLFAQNTSTDARVEYINKYKDIAISEMNRTGIPASIKLAQAILESNAGQSTLAVEANNHFGIKCHSEWKGKEFYKEDDDRDNNGNLIKSCFRKYKKPQESFKDHSEFLTDKKKYYRYGHLFNLDPTDYKSWAYGLQSSGYATAPDYGDRLIRIIENPTYKLYQYDTGKGAVASNDDDGLPPPVANRRTAGRINDVKAVMTRVNESIEDVARIYGISPNKLVCYNDCQYQSTEVMTKETRIFIQHKNKKWRGRNKKHVVRAGETMFDLAQRYGIRLTSLYDMNNMKGGTEPATGEELWLKTGWFSKRKDSPRIADGTTAPSKPTPTVPSTTTGVPPTRPTTTPNPADPGAVLPPGGVYKPDDSELFEVGDGEVQPSTPNTPNTDKPTTTGVPRPDTPYTPTPTTTPTTPRPTQTGSSTSTNTGGHTTPTQALQYHNVIKGDTLYNISKRYNLTVDQLKALNGLQGNVISIGQQLRVK